MSRRKYGPSGKKQVVYGYQVDSGLEASLVSSLIMKKIKFSHEGMKIKFMPPPAKMKTYTPDFILPNGIIIEAKGYFTGSDRKKHILIQNQHPELDIRFVFDDAHKHISSKKLTTYAEWCDKHGFKWAHKSIPDKWLRE